MSQLWLVAGCLLMIVALAQVRPPEHKVVFLDVGQGDAILVQSGTQQMLIDGGPDGAVLQRLGEELPWFDQTIEVLVATHPDKDHIGGLVHVLERYEVGLVVLPEVAHTSQLQNAWLEHIKGALDKRTHYRFAAAGQRLTLNGLTIELLHPRPAQAFGKKTNNASVSTRIDFCPELIAGGMTQFWARRAGSIPVSGLEAASAGSPPKLERRRGETAGSLGAARWGGENERRGWAGKAREQDCLSFLLTGDAESVIERQLAAAYGSTLNVDILKAGHHGSKTSTSEELLAVASPTSVVISVGGDNQYGHPHPDVVERLKNYRVWRTDEHGSVRFTWHDQQWLASTKN